MKRHDLDKYMPLVASFDISDEHKRELLKSVWRIAQNFVDRAHNLDSVQISVQKREADSSGNATDSLYLAPKQKRKNDLKGGPK
ncbi:MAG: hypothetical protein HLUCCA04_02940 [Oceanicaulis sp. HLUCCA04]|nr:MAG: hypothetical protein HLUCCA04_02940 [Oceanicaulis sp. HLUCCA04]